VRYFGPRPLIEDNSVRSCSSTIVNARASDIDYFYASRLPGEPSAGVDDIHTHPAEPRTARLSVLYSF
jgi:hypothetical protein